MISDHRSTGNNSSPFADVTQQEEENLDERVTGVPYLRNNIPKNHINQAILILKSKVHNLQNQSQSFSSDNLIMTRPALTVQTTGLEPVTTIIEKIKELDILFR